MTYNENSQKCQLQYPLHGTRCRPSKDSTAHSGDRNAIVSRTNLSTSNLPSVSRRIDLWNSASKYSSFSWGIHSIIMMSFCIYTKIFSPETPDPLIKVSCDRKYYYLNKGCCILYGLEHSKGDGVTETLIGYRNRNSWSPYYTGDSMISRSNTAPSVMASAWLLRLRYGVIMRKKCVCSII